ncbi:MAG: hypothetical protein KA198_01970 [Chitinophagaceae bacterium]|nr:hypothetical protein [Chitinophagaceae bacterium]
MKRKPLFILIPITLFFAVGGIVMLLWNWLIPVIFGFKAISYIQALGLFLLSRILLGSFGFGNKKPSFGNPKFREKMMNMTDEERQQFKEEWKSRCKK